MLVLTLLAAPDASAQQGADDELTVTVTARDAYEGDDIVFTLRLDRPNPRISNIGMTFAVQAGTATPGLDFTYTDRTALIRPRDTETTISFPTRRDNVTEGDETFTLELLRASPGVNFASRAVTATILDAAPPAGVRPVISIAAGEDITEGRLAEFTLTATPVPANPLEVRVEVTQDQSFAFGSEIGVRSVTVGTDGRGTLLWIATEDDDVNEPDGSITARVVAGAAYDLSGAGTAAVRVRDDDDPAPPVLPVVRIDAGRAIAEGGDATFTLTAQPPPASPLQVDVDVVERGSFVARGQTGRRTVTIATDGRGTLRVATENDGAAEPDGAVTVSLVGSDNRYEVGSPQSASVAVTDAGASPSAPPEVVVLPPDDVTEGRDLQFAVLADSRPDSPLTVTLDVSQTGNVAAGGQTGRRSVTIPGDGRGRGTLVVRTHDDGVNEPEGTVTATIVPSSRYTLSDRSDYRSASARVLDNDPPVISIRGGSAISEGDTATFALTARPRPFAPLDVRVDVTQSGDFADSGQTGSLTVTVGTDGRGTLSVETARDDTDEDDGTITAALVGGGDYALGSPGSASVAVSDGGAPTPRVSISAGPPVNEGGTATFTLTASPLPATGIAVKVTVTDSGRFAAAGETGDKTVFVGTDGRGTLDVRTEDDEVAETNGRITATIAGGTGYAVGSAGSASVVVTDTTPQVSIAAGPGIREGGDAVFTLTAVPAGAVDEVRVDVGEEGGFAAGGETGRRSVTIGAGGTGTLIVQTVDDGRLEADGAITARIEGGIGYAVGAPARASVAVSDATPHVSITPQPSRQAYLEGDEVIFTLTASPAPRDGLSVLVSIAESRDFAADAETGSRQVEVGADGTGTLRVVTEDDETDEPNGEITATIQPAAARDYGIDYPGSATVRVNDDDAGPRDLSITVEDSSVVENTPTRYRETWMEFRFFLSQPASHLVTADFELRKTTASGTTEPATPGEDFDSDTPRLKQVRFWPGETEEVVSVRIHDDDEVEKPETFELVITRTLGAEIADGRAIGTILPDPLDVARGVPEVTVTAGDFVTEGETATFTLKAVPPPKDDLTVNVTVYDDAYTSVPRPSDFVAAADEGAHTVTIPGVSDRLYPVVKDSIATFTVATVDDDVVEPSGGVRVVVDADTDDPPGYGANTRPWEATVHVRDNDGAAPSVTPALSVADVRANESEGVITFLVAADPPVPVGGGPISVRFQTLTWPGGAQRNVDYVDKYGTLTFRDGESTQWVEFTIIDDDHDEGEESFRLYLFNIRGNATLAEYSPGKSALGTIVNTDPLPRALLARFGRTAAVHVVDHVEERLAAPREPGFDGRVAGLALNQGMDPDMALGSLRQLGAAGGMNPHGSGFGGPLSGAAAVGGYSMGPLGMSGMSGFSPNGAPMGAGIGSLGMAGGMGRVAAGLGGGVMGPMGGMGGPAGGLSSPGLSSMGLGGGDLLTSSAFSFNRETRRGGILSFWSRGARSSFGGQQEMLGLNGDVRTTMFGGDYARGPIVAGLSLSHSRGLGEYTGVSAGQVLSSVTGLYPWLGYRATDRITVWGVGGYGGGGLLLTPQGGPSIESGLSMTMAAGGTRGELLSGGASGFELAFKADALWVGTSIDGVTGPAGSLEATDAAVTRFRTGLEGSRAYRLAGRLSLRPSVEVGLRHDGGDAETGVGMEIGAGLVVSDSSAGLSVDVRVSTLLVHQDAGFRERGVALSLSYNPTPSTPLGFNARLAPSWGGQAMGGAQALWGRDSMAGMAYGNVAQGNRLDGEVGYGLPMGSRFVGTPRVGLATSQYGRGYRFGYGLGLLETESLNFELGVDAQRTESPLQGGTSNGFLGQASLGW